MRSDKCNTITNTNIIQIQIQIQIQDKTRQDNTTWCDMTWYWYDRIQTIKARECKSVS